MHIWGDDWFQKNGKDLDEAINYCSRFWTKWGRIGTHSKEKYGTFRDHIDFYRADWAIHELVKPSYVYYQWSEWVMKVDIIIGVIIRFIRLDRLIRVYQRVIYNYAIQKACKKYPHIVDELVSDLDGYALIKPGIFGNVDGRKIHDKHWTKV